MNRDNAARIDGGTSIGILRYITLPLMRPFIALGITSTSVTAINVFDEIIALAGYSDLAKNILVESYLTTFKFLNFGKGRAIIKNILLITMVIPVMATIIPLYKIFSTAKLLDNMFWLCVVYVSSYLPMVTWMISNYLSTIPKEIEEAAKIDGCNELKQSQWQ